MRWIMKPRAISMRKTISTTRGTLSCRACRREEEWCHGSEGDDGGQESSPAWKNLFEEGAQPGGADQCDGYQDDGVEHYAPQVAL